MTAVLEQETLDMAAAHTLVMQMLKDGQATMLGVLSAVGDRLGLFESLATHGPIGSEAFATRSGIDARYAREWLSAMACQGYITYDERDDAFRMTPEQRLCLVDAHSPLYLSGGFAIWPVYWNNLDELTEVFRNGGGIPQDRFGDDWRCGFERFSTPGYSNFLGSTWIPAMPEVAARLAAGGSAADVGCGNGQALIALAHTFPSASLDGFDLYAPAITDARSNARNAGVESRINFTQQDIVNGLPRQYDLITMLDVVHDLPDPVLALAALRGALKPGGRLFVMEFNFSSELAENVQHPMGLGAFGYAASVNYCLTTALAVGGVGTGTCMGERVFREYAAAAGFTHVRRHDFPASPLNLFFEVWSEEGESDRA
ncbi:MAG: methyltransferase domain-containing protein [Thermomicrobiales bacterium]|nr:methyltransferase domain-containing protein [Thermomicrobiales bacterium]MCA9876850.1 methyltransferase domain-containing protein [Thermomicrobiales bacterium]